MNYKGFLVQTKLFADKLHVATPRITPQFQNEWPVVRQRVATNRIRLMGPSPVDIVDGLKEICTVFSLSRWPDLDVAARTYLATLNLIDYGQIEEIEVANPDYALEIEALKVQIGADLERILAETEKEIGIVLYQGPLVGVKDAGRNITVQKSIQTRKRASVRDAASAPSAAPPAEEPRLRVRLSGEKVKGRAVQAGSSCRLTVDWGVLVEGALAELQGKELQRAREARLQILFVLYSGPFAVAGNRTRIETRFQDDGFETPVEFDLAAPADPMSAKVFLELRVQGRTTYRLPLGLDVVRSIDAVAPGDVPAPVRLDLDRLIEESRRPEPAAILDITSFGAPPSAVLKIIHPYDELRCQHDGLRATNLTQWMSNLAYKMDEVSKDPVWDVLADPLAPTADELEKLSDPLVKVADAGSNLHDKLAKFAGLKKILDRIDALPPGSRIIVNVDEVAIPWELVYPAAVRKENGAAGIDVARFWGYRFQFETYLTAAKYDLPGGASAAREEHRKAARKLTAVLNQKIDAERSWTAGAPVAYQCREFERARGPALSAVDLKSDCSATRRLLESEKTDGSFIYFYCHGGTDTQQHAELLQIDEECRIEVDEVKGERTFTGAPIVFLNSCTSGPLASVPFDSFCARFQHKGALGLITTSFAVPVPFAAHFGCRLIIAYMKGEGALGDLLLELRKKALDARIPIGLFYMLRCSADIRLPALQQ